jgi:hypothetical protein
VRDRKEIETDYSLDSEIKRLLEVLLDIRDILQGIHHVFLDEEEETESKDEFNMKSDIDEQDLQDLLDNMEGNENEDHRQ